MREVHYSAFLDFVIVLEKHLTIGFINNYITGQSLRGKKWKELICLSQIPICQVFILWEIISSAILVVHIWINHKISHIASLQRSFKVCIYKQIHTFIDTYVCVCVCIFLYILYLAPLPYQFIGSFGIHLNFWAHNSELQKLIVAIKVK